MENEIMTNGVTESVEEIVEATPAKNVNVVASIGMIVIVGGLTYKFAVKPIYAKLKAKRDAKTTTQGEVIDIIDENENMN